MMEKKVWGPRAGMIDLNWNAGLLNWLEIDDKIINGIQKSWIVGGADGRLGISSIDRGVVGSYVKLPKGV